MQLVSHSSSDLRIIRISRGVNVSTVVSLSQDLIEDKKGDNNTTTKIGTQLSLGVAEPALEEGSCQSWTPRPCSLIYFQCLLWTCILIRCVSVAGRPTVVVMLFSVCHSDTDPFEHRRHHWDITESRPGDTISVLCHSPAIESLCTQVRTLEFHFSFTQAFTSDQLCRIPIRNSQTAIAQCMTQVLGSAKVT